jgi:predicted regulator of Ras-like GTPase activity (Roadblock/LC7/MglB family)
MMQWAQERSAVQERVRAELQALRSKVAGIRGCLVATNDGMLVAHDFPGADPMRLAALVSTALGLARQAVSETGRGMLREAVARGTSGYLMVYAAGDGALVAIAADDQTPAGKMQFEARQTVARITVYSSAFPAWSSIDYLTGNSNISPEELRLRSLPDLGINGLPVRKTDETS